MSTDYERAVRRWVGTWRSLEAADEVSLEAETDYFGGCDTCGYGRSDGFVVYVNGHEVKRFDFSDLSVILTGLLAVDE